MRTQHGYKPCLCLAAAKGQDRVGHRGRGVIPTGIPQLLVWSRQGLPRVSHWGSLPDLQGPPLSILGSPLPPEAMGHLALRLLNLGSGQGHPVFQLRQRLVRGPGGLGGVLRARGALFPSVCLACRGAPLGKGGAQRERRQVPPSKGLLPTTPSLRPSCGEGPLRDRRGSAACPGLRAQPQTAEPGPTPAEATAGGRTSGVVLGGRSEAVLLPGPAPSSSPSSSDDAPASLTLPVSSSSFLFRVSSSSSASSVGWRAHGHCRERAGGSAFGGP